MNDLPILQRACVGGNNQKTMRCTQNSLVIFARTPLPGAVKTRLIGARLALDSGLRVLDAADAATLYAAFLRDTIDLAKHVENCEVAVAHAWDAARPEYSLQDFWRGPVWPQGAGDLGAKLERALNETQKRGAQRVAVIGSDAPDLPAALIETAMEKLHDHDLVFGPAHDGGFYLIGASHEISPQLFRGVAWSTPRVHEQVLENAARLKLSAHRLESWRDVDEEDDLRALISRLKSSDAAPFTREVLASWKAL